MLETARQTEASTAWRGAAASMSTTCSSAVWLGELLWWRGDPRRYFQQPPWMRWALRGFYFVVVFNAAVIFAALDRRLAGVAVTAALVAAWAC